MTAKLLLEEVLENASEKNLRKAQRLLNAKRVFNLNYNKGNNEITARVYSEGSPEIYDVQININEEGFYEATCTCPYDWGDDCKHIIAVTLLAKQKYIFEKPAVAVKEITIRIAPPWAAGIQRLSPKVPYNFYYQQHKVEVIALTEKGFAVQYSSALNDEKEIIKIEEEENNLLITGNGAPRQNRLSPAMLATITILTQNLNTQFNNVDDIPSLDNLIKSALRLKANVQEPLLKDYAEYVKEKDLTYEIINGQIGLLMKDTSLILPPHLKNLSDNVYRNILSDRLTYNQNLLGTRASSNDWGFGFFMVSKGAAIAPEVNVMKGKWDKERRGFKSSLTQVKISEDSSDFCDDPVFLQLVFQCRQLLRYNRLVNKRNNYGGPPNSELYQAFVSVHEMLLKLIPQLNKYPFYVTDYSPNQWDSSLRKNDTHLFKLETEPVRLKLNCTEGSAYFDCQCELLHRGEALPVKDFSFFNQYFIRQANNNVLYHFSTAAETWLFQELMVRKNLRTPIKLKEQFIKHYLIPVSKKVTITYNDKPLVEEEANNELTATKLYLSELGENILLQPHVVYGPFEIELFSEDEYVKDGNGKFLHLVRQKEREEELKQFFVSLHPQFAGQLSRGFLYFHYREMLHNNWFMEMFEQLNARQIEILGFNKLSKLKYNPNKPSINISVGSGIDWFDIQIKVEFGNQVADLKEVRRAVLRKEQYVTLGDGSLGILPQEWIEKYSRYFGAGEVKKDAIHISKFQFSLLDDFEDDLIDAKTLKELQVKRKRLKEFEEIKKAEVPPQLKAELRHYQEHGLAWLNFLDEFGWGGCLADDMGLGKTVQCIAFLLQQIEKYPDVPNLVVMPTTLLFNWEQELKKFAPSIVYHIHYGAEREEEQLKNKRGGVILTSYGILFRDIEIFKEMTFNYIVLDESQAIKNPLSQRYKSVRMLQGRNRLAMTGTPVENNTMELYSQMNFLNPGIFGAQEAFRKDYATAIDKEGSEGMAAKLRKIIKPFLIRRTKEQVARELPGKTEMTLYCEMGEQQRRVYEAFKQKIRTELLEKIEQEGMNKARFAVLDGLLKLRQICNSPALLNTTEDYGNDSVKIDELIRAILEKTGQHKILVFSQFVGMLDLIRKKLDAEQINYEYLDGQSRKRQASVEHFQNDENCRVFLISLKAGGTGLNLTAADYVYVVDPWWNPAVEDQAIDRTYRIGQDKKVFAYRMICHNTIEEKILTLQAKKKKVVKDIISVEDGFVKALNKEDVMNLLL